MRMRMQTYEAEKLADLCEFLRSKTNTKSYRKELTFRTKTRRAYINITPQVEALLVESGIREGLCLVNAMNITASVFINDNESGLHRDFER